MKQAKLNHHGAERLGLDPAQEQKLKVAAATFLREWKNKYPDMRARHGQNPYYDSHTLHRIAVTFMEKGWSMAKIEILPGKDLWRNLDVTSDKPGFLYPRDKERILEGVKEIFNTIQSGQELGYQGALNGARKRKRDEQREKDHVQKDEESELPDIDDLRTQMSPQSVEQPRRKSDRITRNKDPVYKFDNALGDLLRSRAARLPRDKSKKSGLNPRTPPKGIETVDPCEESTYTAADEASSDEKSLAVYIADKRKDPISKGIALKRNSLVSGNNCSPTLAAQLPSQDLASQLGSSAIDAPASGMYTSLALDSLILEGEESQPSFGTTEVTAPLKSHQDRIIDQPTLGTTKVTAPSKSHQDRTIDQPVRVIGSGRSASFWILKRKHPRKAWVLWPGVDLIKENLQSIFAATAKQTDLTDFRSLEVTLQTPDQSFTFSTSPEDDHFEDVKLFMAHMIEASCHDNHGSNVLTSVWISPMGHTEANEELTT